MPDSEFDLIKRHFSHLGPARADVLLGVGDDCALLRPPLGVDLALSLDTLVCGRHFFADVDPEALGHKALAVNLSDLAAMGAEPAWATLALTLPHIDHAWLEAFARGFSRLAEQTGIGLIGGDTTRGPLSISIQIHGLIPMGEGMRRSAARAGDIIFVSGHVGGAALALRQMRQGRVPEASLRRNLEWPQPRLQLGQRLRHLAHACIDISDGLLADLGHICSASDLGAELYLDRLPRSAAVAQAADWSLPLSGGDDYELCFTVADEKRKAVLQLADELDLPLTPVGIMRPGRGVLCRHADGSEYHPLHRGFDHFHD